MSPTAAKARTDTAAIGRVALGVYAALAVAYFLPAFLPGRQIGGSDYFAGGYQFLEFAIRRLGEGHLPKWVPFIYGGLPMYSNPGGLFYPVRLLMSAILPVSRVMPALYVVQFAAAGIGMHLLVRALGVRPWVALVAGIAFELTGILLSNIYAGHDGRLIVATLAPMAFYLILRGVRTGELKWFFGLAGVLGLVLLSAQIQSAYYLLIAGAVWAVFLLVLRRHEMRPGSIAGRLTLGISAVALAFAVAAVNLLPFSTYVKDSPRAETANRDYAFSTQFSMPPVETIGFAVPEQAGFLTAYTGESTFKLHTEYVGAFVILMLLLGLFVARRDRVWQFLALLGAFMMSVSFGSNTPIYSLYYKFLPGTSKFRSPSIALFVVALCLVVMAALTMERIAAAIDARREAGDTLLFRRIYHILTGTVALALCVFLVSAGTAIDGSTRAMGWARFAVFLLGTSLVIRALMRGRMTLKAATIGLAMLTAADLLLVGRHFIYTEESPTEVFARDDVVRYLEAHSPGRVWVFPFPEEPDAPHYLGNGRFGQHSDYLMGFRISQAGGEHGNQLYRWNQLVGIRRDGNTLDWHNFVEYPAIMEAASIRYIVSGVKLELFDMKTRRGMPGIVEVHNGSGFIYVNNRALARAHLIPAVRTVPPGKALDSMRVHEWDPRSVAFVEAERAPFPSPAVPPPGPPDSLGLRTGGLPSPGSAQIDLDDPDRVEISKRATSPALLVLNDNYADGWTATVDGRDTPILRTNHTFRGVPVAAGAHKVVFTFRPAPLYAGLRISIAAVVIIALGLGATTLLRRTSTRDALSGAAA